MGAVTDLLPDNAQTFEKGLAAGFDDTLPVAIREALDPDTAPVALLDHLAALEGVPLWFGQWSEARKRQMLKEALRLGMMRGTLEGLDRLLAYVDAQIIIRRAWPLRWFAGSAYAGVTPFGGEPFRGRYTVKVALEKKPGALFANLGHADVDFAHSTDLGPIRRSMTAMRAAKTPETEYLVAFDWRRRARFGDFDTFADATFGYVDRAASHEPITGAI